MKRIIVLFLALSLVLGLISCTKTPAEDENTPNVPEQKTDTPDAETETQQNPDVTRIALSDNGIAVDGEAIPCDDTADVYAAHDIVYYHDGQDFTYGEGDENDAHSAEEADAHTVVHIAKAGVYEISGKLSHGQVAVDLGDDAKTDPEAVVTLVLNNADITCTVAPAVIFYKVYECGDKENAASDVDTTAAGANIVIADGSVNTLNGSYVAKIYKSVTLSEDGSEIVESKKLHKYDGTLYSKMSMNIRGEEAGDGILNVNAENEGIDSELHLTIWGGDINIVSGDDGINTNEDGVSVTTVNGGTIHIRINGKQGEGDGIDSNGWITINGGTVIAEACATSGDAGIDSDNGIHLNGGTVIASGNMYDAIDDSEQNYIVFTFRSTQRGGKTYQIKNADGDTVLECAPTNAFTYLIVSSPDLAEGEYSLECDGEKLPVSNGSAGGMGGMRDFDGERPELPDGFRDERPDGMPEPPEGFDGERPELPDGFRDERPDGMPEPPEGFDGAPMRPDGDRKLWQENADESNASDIFTVVTGGNFFTAS